VFRGSKRADWALLTSLDRLGGTNPPHGKQHLEEHILRNFIRYSRPHLQQQPANEWELLVTAQHHGLPRACWTGPTRRWWPRTSPPWAATRARTASSGA
jgi:hypothetical protein